jgi:hypothetical protein
MGAFSSLLCSELAFYDVSKRCVAALSPGCACALIGAPPTICFPCLILHNVVLGVGQCLTLPNSLEVADVLPALVCVSMFVSQLLASVCSGPGCWARHRPSGHVRGGGACGGVGGGRLQVLHFCVRHHGWREDVHHAGSCVRCVLCHVTRTSYCNRRNRHLPPVLISVSVVVVIVALSTSPPVPQFPLPQSFFFFLYIGLNP